MFISLKAPFLKYCHTYITTCNPVLAVGYWDSLYTCSGSIVSFVKLVTQASVIDVLFVNLLLPIMLACGNFEINNFDTF